MVKKTNRKFERTRRHIRVRRKISGTAERPRLCVYRSNTNIYAQVIDDVAGKTLVSASTLDKEVKTKKANKEAAKENTSPSCPAPSAMAGRASSPASSS